MIINVKTLGGDEFEVDVEPEDTVAEVKKIIEAERGKYVYAAADHILIHQGKVLDDATTLEQNEVEEDSVMVIMSTRGRAPRASRASTALSTPTNEAAQPASSLPPTLMSPSTTSQVPTSTIGHTVSSVDGQAASHLVAISNLEPIIQQILDMGGGSWDRDTIICALLAAFNNPERAVEFIYSGIPEQAEVPAVARVPTVEQAGNPTVQAQQPPVPTGGPNSNPLNLFPKGVPSMGTNVDEGSLDFLRNNQQFQALRAMLLANPQILQPILQELGKQNPHLMGLIQERQADFLGHKNEPAEGKE